MNFRNEACGTSGNASNLMDKPISLEHAQMRTSFLNPSCTERTKKDHTEILGQNIRRRENSKKERGSLQNPGNAPKSLFFGTSENSVWTFGKEGRRGGLVGGPGTSGGRRRLGAVGVVVIDLLPSFPDILLPSVYYLDPSEKAACRNCNNDMNGNRRHAYPLRLFTWEPPRLTYLPTRVYVCPFCDAL
jgi:hypothetical protein